MKTIKIKEDVRIPGTDVILEAGDTIRVINSPIKKLVEGQFSWYTSDTGQQIIIGGPPREIWMTGHDGRVFHQKTPYEGYGVFGGKDFYEYLAELNGYRSDRGIGIDLFYQGSPTGDTEKAERRGVKIPRLYANKSSLVNDFSSFPPPASDPNQGWYDEDEY